MYRLLLLLTIVLAPTVWGGGVNSGGGYVVACKENETTSYEFLDLFEGKETISGFKIKDLPVGNDEFEIAKSVIDRIAKFSPKLAAEWKQTVTDFKTRELKFVTNAQIKDIQDDEMILKPLENCRTIQAAVQVKQPAKNEFRLYIDAKIWKDLNPLTKSALLVHEAIYKMAMQQGHEKSIKFRRITSLLFSEELETASDAYIADIFNSAEINGCFVKNFSFTNIDESQPYTQFQLKLEIKSFSMDPNDNISAIICEEEVKDKFFNIGPMVVQKGNIVHSTPHRICIEKNNELRNNVQFFKREYGKPSIKMEEKVCLGDSGKDKVLFARISPLIPEFIQPEALKFDKCIDQGFYEGKIETCGSVRAQITSADGQVLNLDDYRLNDYMYLNWHGFLINESSRKFRIGETTFKLARVVHISEDLNINLTTSSGDQIVSLNGIQCRIENGHVLVLNPRGDLIKIKPHLFSEKSSKADSCVKLFNPN